MEKLFNTGSLVFATIGGFFAWLFGGYDVLLATLLTFVVLDYITGLIKGAYTKTLSSEIGFKGLLKKILIFIVVAVAVILQRLIGTSIPIREVVILFYIANEGISLMENCAMFIPFPQKLKDLLLQIRDKSATSQSSTDDSSP